ncbi:MAG: adenylosuccinate synthetase [Gammaproteobacteria bacterium]|nr:adenylosuccinate synthetase [Gammaproteobacteria bacterium]
MTVTVVVGGQYGSEGKGKIAHWLAREQDAELAIRVGGPNSGHTAVSAGQAFPLRQVPTPCLHDGVIGLLPAGSYIDVDVLLAEVKLLGLTPRRLVIHPDAVVIGDAARRLEFQRRLTDKIGSTGQGVGGAIAKRVLRDPDVMFAKHCRMLRDFVSRDAHNLAGGYIKERRRVVVEGTQGFGLSLLHSGRYPYVTSRDTTAAAVLSEAGISPLAVDCIALVLRAFPIRVGGNSGVLENETTWEDVTLLSGSCVPLLERTTATRRIRRVGRFDAALARRAVEHNLPTIVALNHVDYFDYAVHERTTLSDVCYTHVAEIETQLGCPVQLVGTGPSTIIERPSIGWQFNSAA